MKSFGYYMRVWHRYIGFFTVGLFLIYAISGIALIFRDTDLFKVDNRISTTISPNLNKDNIEAELKLKGFKVISENDSLIIFNTGTYNKINGNLKYGKKEFIFPLNKFSKLHMLPSKASPIHLISLLLGVALIFLALSSFWMYKPNSKIFKKGMWITGAGILLSLLMLLLL